MRVPLQLALNFYSDQSKNPCSLEIPIDNFFPEDAANKLAALESYNKHLYRPNTYLHKWWARRSGTTFRHILKQLVDNPGKQDFYEGGGLEGKIILDPMIGGGTTLHEAIRMGANVIGMDIDPIPVLQAKASLTQASLNHKKVIFSEFIETLQHKLGHFFKTDCPICGKESEMQFVLYGLRKKCSCREVIVIDSLVLRHGNHSDVNICPLCHEVYTGETHNCRGLANSPLMVKGDRHCEKCHMPYVDILDEPFFDRYIPLVNTGECSGHGTFFKNIDNSDLKRIHEAFII